MKALTSKNYEKLPEVRKKKELEEKKLDFKKRQENAKKLQQVLFNKVLIIQKYFHLESQRTICKEIKSLI